MYGLTSAPLLFILILLATPLSAEDNDLKKLNESIAKHIVAGEVGPVISCLQLGLPATEVNKQLAKTFNKCARQDNLPEYLEMLICSNNQGDAEAEFYLVAGQLMQMSFYSESWPRLFKYNWDEDNFIKTHFNYEKLGLVKDGDGYPDSTQILYTSPKGWELFWVTGSESSSFTVRKTTDLMPYENKSEISDGSTLPQIICPETKLSLGIAEGHYLGNECGDFCWSAVELDTGKQITFMCSEDAAEEYFGIPGNKVSVEYETIQYWSPFGRICLRNEMVKTGRIITKQSPKVAEVFTLDMLGARIEYLESRVGPAMRISGQSRLYNLDGCKVEVIGTDEITSMKLLQPSAVCNFDFAKFLPKNNNDKWEVFQSLPINLMTIGQLGEAVGLDGRFSADCLLRCGNAAVSSIYVFYEWSRSYNFLQLKAEIALDVDSAVSAAKKWRDQMIKEQGEDWVIEANFNSDARYDQAALEAFSGMPISSIQIGYGLDR